MAVQNPKSSINFKKIKFVIILILIISMKTSFEVRKTRKEIDSCTICMTRLVNCKTVECSHEFCYRCLSKWGRRKGNCPMCRQNIRKIQYKNKIIEPRYLQIFDQHSLQEEPRERYDFPRYVYQPIYQPIILFTWYPYFANSMDQIQTFRENNNFHIYGIQNDSV